VPGLIEPVELLEKGPDGTLHPYHLADEGDERIALRDGSFESDVPLEALAATFGATFTIVSQVQPSKRRPSTLLLSLSLNTAAMPLRPQPVPQLTQPPTPPPPPSTSSPNLLPQPPPPMFRRSTHTSPPSMLTCRAAPDAPLAGATARARGVVASCSVRSGAPLDLT
jgi:predicted acylesterase/phospholipase RssA